MNQSSILRLKHESQSKEFVISGPTVKDELVKLIKKNKELEERLLTLEQKFNSYSSSPQTPYKTNNYPVPTISKTPLDINSIVNQNTRRN